MSRCAVFRFCPKHSQFATPVAPTDIFRVSAAPRVLRRPQLRLHFAPNGFPRSGKAWRRSGIWLYSAPDGTAVPASCGATQRFRTPRSQERSGVRSELADAPVLALTNSQGGCRGRGGSPERRVLRGNSMRRKWVARSRAVQPALRSTRRGTAPHPNPPLRSQGRESSRATRFASPPSGPPAPRAAPAASTPRARRPPATR